MSQKRHEKVLRRKAKKGRRDKQLREARRQQRIETRHSDLAAVFGDLMPGQGADMESLVAGVAEGGTEEKVRVMKESLNRLHGRAGEAG